jgi:hypothetical protein
MLAQFGAPVVQCATREVCFVVWDFWLDHEQPGCSPLHLDALSAMLPCATALICRSRKRTGCAFPSHRSNYRQTAGTIFGRESTSLDVACKRSPLRHVKRTDTVVDSLIDSV